QPGLRALAGGWQQSLRALAKREYAQPFQQLPRRRRQRLWLRRIIGIQMPGFRDGRSEEHTSELQSRGHLVCRLLLEKKNKKHEAKRADRARHFSYRYFSKAEHVFHKHEQSCTINFVENEPPKRPK